MTQNLMTELKAQSLGRFTPSAVLKGLMVQVRTDLDDPMDQTDLDDPVDLTAQDGPENQTYLDGPVDLTDRDGPENQTDLDGPVDLMDRDGPENQTDLDGQANPEGLTDQTMESVARNGLVMRTYAQEDHL